MREFKIGDKIKLIGEVVYSDKCSTWDYGVPLKDLINKELVVKKVDGDGDLWYNDGNHYVKPEMAELVEDKRVEEKVLGFKVGDKVRLREKLELGRHYNGWEYNGWRSDYQGKIMTIMRIDIEGDVLLEELSDNSYFGTHMLELVSKTDIPYEPDIQSIESDTVEVDDFEDIHGLNIGREQVEDVVNHPSHYNNGSIEAIEVIEDWKLNFHLGNAVKYINRAEHKGNYKQDIEKAIWYLNRAIES